jgi:hypothetical protein
MGFLVKSVAGLGMAANPGMPGMPGIEPIPGMPGMGMGLARFICPGICIMAALPSFSGLPGILGIRLRWGSLFSGLRRFYSSLRS